MQIDSIDVFHVALPLHQPLAVASGTSDNLETVLVRIRSGELSGWGEANPGNAPMITGEWAASAFTCIRDWLAPALVKTMVESADDLQKRLAAFQSNRFAKAALDAAWWDLEARRQGKPLHQLVGGERPAVEIGITFDQMETIDDLLEAMFKAVKAGYSRIGLKFRPGWDIQMVNLVRHEFPTESIHIECDGALRLEQMEILCRLDDFTLSMIQQPLPADDLVGHAMVQETVRTPICLYESISTVEQAAMALELHSGQFIKVEPGRVGGLTKAIAIDATCHENCTPCWAGALPQSAIGARIGLALAARPNFSYPADFFDASAMLAADVGPALQPVIDAEDGKLKIPLGSEPGIGIEPDMAVIKQYALGTATV